MKKIRWILLLLTGLLVWQLGRYALRQKPANLLINPLKELTSTATPTPTDPNLLLPDLIILPPKELYIQTSGNQKKIRFSTTFANQGEGALELIGESDPISQTTQAKQIIYKKDGSTTSRAVGEFIFHPEHDHWHLENVNAFELWTIDAENNLQEKLASVSKISFCIQDWEIYSIETAKKKIYQQCNQEKQGISIGWADVYAADVEGQELDITNVNDGQYAIRSLIDPDNKILESDEDNNDNTVLIELKNNSIIKISE